MDIDAILIGHNRPNHDHEAYDDGQNESDAHGASLLFFALRLLLMMGDFVRIHFAEGAGVVVDAGGISGGEGVGIGWVGSANAVFGIGILFEWELGWVMDFAIGRVDVMIAIEIAIDIDEGLTDFGMILWILFLFAV